jgi:hypothetical protein
MAKFRKRPVVVEASQFHGFYATPYPDGVDVEGSRCYVTTIHEQRAYLDNGDWVITESDGLHHYPCKPSEFERIYESVDDK